MYVAEFIDLKYNGTAPTVFITPILFQILLQTDQDTIRQRVQELSDFANDLELQLAEIRNDLVQTSNKNLNDGDRRHSILEAKVQDISDRLRLGMAKMQVAIGESSLSSHNKDCHLSPKEVNDA